jgi:small GTP-binding protein
MDRDLTVQIWDTAGQERYRALSPLYTRGAACTILVFALDSPESWELIGPSYDTAVALGVQNFIVAANKSDLVVDGAGPLAFDDVRAWCDARGLRVIRTSAETGANVGHLFQSVAEIVAATEPEVLEGINVAEKERMQRACPCA